MTNRNTTPHTPRLHQTTLVTAIAIALASMGQAYAQSSTDSTSTDQQLEQVTVSQGRGQLRSVHGLTKSDFDNANPGTSPLVTVSRLPGVNFQSADPLGNSEWSTPFTVASFSQNQLGFTLDDVPLGDMSYGNFNGLHISRAISSENVARAFLSQGAGSLETASSSNLGGTLQFYSDNARKDFGVEVQGTLGNYNNRRSYFRLDSGDTGAGKFFLSYTNQDSDKWKGSGEQRQEQVNFKYQADFGEHHLSAFYNTSKRREIDYQDMSLEMINRLGYNWDNFYPDFSKALVAAQTLCGNGSSTYVAACDDAYYAGSGLRNDGLGGISFDAKLSDQIRLKTTLYTHSNEGRGLWYTPYTASPDGTPLSLRTTDYDIKRNGIVANLSYDLESNQIKIGLWHEDNTFNQARRFYAVSPTSVPSPYDFPSNPFFTQWQYKFVTATDQLSVSDTYAATKSLTLGAGFKSLRVSTDGQLQIGTGPSGTVVAQNGFLPQFGLNFQLSPTDELFATLSRNIRAFQGAATGTTPWATTAAGFAAIKDSLKPETSDTLEGGWRTHGALYQATLTGYLVNFRDRLLGVQQGAGIQGNPTVLSNVGGVKSVGVEAALSFRLAPAVNWYNSISQSSSTYQDDVVSNGVAVATSGKHVVDAPDTIVKSSLGYDDGKLFGSLGVDYMSSRYYTYLNDNSVGARTLVNLSGGYRLKGVGFLKDARIQLGVTNLTDQKYISTVGSNGFTNTDPTGTGQTLLTGAPRQAFVTFEAKL